MSTIIKMKDTTMNINREPFKKRAKMFLHNTFFKSRRLRSK